MPELPEVEILRLQLSQLIVGKTIKSIDILKAKSFIGDKRQVIGEKIVGIRRFAKILVVDLAIGLSLVIHLKMSGQLIFQNTRQLRSSDHQSDVVDSFLNKHTRVIITFIDNSKLFFNDQRIFGWIKVVRDLLSITNKLGPDPFNFTNKKFYQILQISKRPIKLVLMDQEKIGGVGNIYANDALFLSKINPKTPASGLSKVQAEVLFHKLLKVLIEGIKWRGASQNNFRDAYGAKGEKQEHFYVYAQEGKKCINKCGETIKRISLGGRGTFYCPVCQV